METVINTTPDTCDQNKVTVNPQIEKNNAKRANQECSKGTITTNQKTKYQHTERDVNGWEMTEIVKMKIRYLKDHAKTSLRQIPDHFVLHVDKNDLDPDRPPELIAKSITDTATTLRSEKHDVTVSNIISRNDHLQTKAKKVNVHLARLCKENSFSLIDHAERIKPTHINHSKLHLNRHGYNILQDTFVQALSKIINCYDSEGNIENVDVTSPPEDGYESDSETAVNNIDYNLDLRSLRKKNLNKILVAHLNISSLRNKFEFLIEQIERNIDILMISGKKFDKSFPFGQFLIKRFSTPFQLDRNDLGGGVLWYITEDIPSKLLSIEENGIGFYIEVSLKNKQKHVF